MKLLFFALLIFVGLASPAAVQAQRAESSIGIQTWTLRNLTFERAVEFAVRHKIKYLQLYDSHLDPKAPLEETKRKKRILDENGLVCYAVGVAGTSLDAGADRKLFEFARTMGIKLIVIEPADFKMLDHLERLVREYDIRVAIHNHGGQTLYGNPAVVRNLIRYRDPRIGVCLDVGWATSAGFDAERVFREYEGRVFDIHLKDVKVDCRDNRPVTTNVPIGAGDANLTGLFKALRETKYAGVLAIETDLDLKDPTEFVTSALKYLATNR